MRRSFYILAAVAIAAGGIATSLCGAAALAWLAGRHPASWWAKPTGLVGYLVVGMGGFTLTAIAFALLLDRAAKEDRNET